MRCAQISAVSAGCAEPPKTAIPRTAAGYLAGGLLPLARLVRRQAEAFPDLLLDDLGRGPIIRHGAKMIAAMSDATVPKICVVVRKAYGAGLYAMAGPGFEPDATLALPTAKIAVMGAEAAVNAVYAGKLDQIADEQAREAETGRLRREYERDIDILRLASELVVDDIVEPEDLRDELVRRFAVARGKDRTPPRRRHGISPA